MASTKEYLNYILGQLSELEEITHYAMMGEFIIYYHGKIVGGIYNNQLLVKPVSAAKELMPNAPFTLPYEGAKEMLLVENVDLDAGTLGIYHSKGYKDRTVYMSEDIRQLCLNFHRYYGSVLPGRKYFFQPSLEKEHYTKTDVDNAFGRIRAKMVSCPKKGKLPSAHGLRHLFAVEK